MGRDFRRPLVSQRGVQLASSSVYSLAPYSSDTAPRTLNSSDSIYSQAGGTRAEVGLTGSAASGFVGRIVVGVNPKKTPARV